MNKRFGKVFEKKIIRFYFLKVLVATCHLAMCFVHWFCVDSQVSLCGQPNRQWISQGQRTQM